MIRFYLNSPRDSIQWILRPLGCCLLVLSLLGSMRTANGQVEPVTVRVPEPTAWVGQRIPFFVELHANGSFDGSANFDLPQVPGSLILKIGNPVVSSRQLDGETWFIQTHEFALFSQRPGKLEIPRFSVRFSNRTGFVGDAQGRDEWVPAMEFEIKRPPGTEKLGFLISTNSYSVEETWDPAPGPASVGDIFKRTIVQRASQLSGMALAPASTTVPDGIRVYASDAQTQDELERGNFVGTRTETITYLLTQPGTHTLPAVKYAWWNPDDETAKSTTLPSVEFIVEAAATSESTSNDDVESNKQITIWGISLAFLALTGLVLIFFRETLNTTLRNLKTKLNPPDRVAARALIQAAKNNDATKAERSWNQWRNTQPSHYRPGPKLQTAVVSMESQLFGRNPDSADWQGQELASAFKEERSEHEQEGIQPDATLPKLNP